MKNEVLSRLVQEIQRNRTWVDVRDSSILREFAIVSGGSLKLGLFPAIVLVCKVPCHGYCKGQEWLIPEFDIDKVIHRLKRDDAPFRRRLRRHNITMADAETIINRATYGIINLELEEW